MSEQKKRAFIISLFLLGFIFIQSVYAQPLWMNENQLNILYPENEYLVAVESSTITGVREIVEESAKLNALAELSRQIESKTDPEILSRIISENTNREEMLKLKLQSGSGLSLFDVKYEVYYDARFERATALAVMNKIKSRDIAVSKVKSLRIELFEQFDDAKECISNGDKINATSKLNYCFSYLSSIEQYLDLALVCSNDEKEIKEVDKLITSKDNRISRFDIEAALNNLGEIEISSLANAADYLSQQINPFLEQNCSLYAGGFFYENTLFTSDFAERLKSLIQQKLNASWVTGKSDNTFPSTNRVSSKEIAGKCGANRVLEARLLPSDKFITIIVVLWDVSGVKNDLTAEVKIPTSVIHREGLTAIPMRYDELKDESRLLTDAMTKSGNKTLEFWTNFGAKGLTLHEGEEVQFLVRTSVPGYLRLIYQLTTGEKIVLLDNFQISPEQANTIQAIPFTFEVAPPFGNERALAYFSESPFPPLELITTMIDGELYEDVITSTFRDMVVNTRGLKKKKSKLVLEAALEITTMSE